MPAEAVVMGAHLPTAQQLEDLVVRFVVTLPESELE